MRRKFIPVQVEKCFLYRCKISERNTYQTQNYWEEHHKVEEIKKGLANAHYTLLAVHVYVCICVCVCWTRKCFFFGRGGYCHQIYVHALQMTISLSIKTPKNDNITTKL